MLHALSAFIVLAFMVVLTVVIIPWVLRRLTGSMSKQELDELKQRNALVLDVRSPYEYAHGKVNDSINIPLEDLPERVQELDPTRPILICCASGVRSAKAKTILEAKGFTMVYNGGAWTNAR